jgi:hypothetical protein
MKINTGSVNTSVEEMLQRMGELLVDVTASRTGLADEINEIKKFHRIPEPGLGEKLDMTT